MTTSVGNESKKSDEIKLVGSLVESEVAVVSYLTIAFNSRLGYVRVKEFPTGARNRRKLL